MSTGDKGMNVEASQFLSMIQKAYEKGSTEQEMTVRQLIEEIKEDLRQMIKN